MPKKRKATKSERVEWEKAQAFFKFLNEVNEKTWQASTEAFIRAIGGSEEEATDRSRWFSKPDIYNKDGSNQVKAETVLTFRNLFKSTIKTLSESQDAAKAITPILFLMFNLLPPKEELGLTITRLLQMTESSGKESELKNLRIFERIRWGILDEIAVESMFMLPVLHQQHKIGWCEECGKLFLRKRRSQRWCSKKCRDLVYNRPSRIAKASQRKI